MKDLSSGKAKLMSIYDYLYEYYGPQGWWPANGRFEVIVGAILTQNTAWTNVEKAILNLKRAKILSPLAIKKVDTGTLSKIIRPAGYYNVKSRRLKNFVDFLFAKYGGSLARLSRQKTAELRRELLGVNGVGPETCDSILLYAFGRPVFVIDAYTKRIFARHGFFEIDTDYDEARKFFMNELPKKEKLYNEYHALIVRLGKDFCRKASKCKGCPLGSYSEEG